MYRCKKCGAILDIGGRKICDDCQKEKMVRSPRDKMVRHRIIK